jgi:hypothetical protein
VPKSGTELRTQKEESGTEWSELKLLHVSCLTWLAACVSPQTRGRWWWWGRVGVTSLTVRKGKIQDVRGCIQKFPDWVDNETNNNNNKHSLRSNTKGYVGKTHQTDSINSDTTALSGTELYHLRLSRQVASPETFGYTLVHGTISLDPADCVSQACHIMTQTGITTWSSACEEIE